MRNRRRTKWRCACSTTRKKETANNKVISIIRKNVSADLYIQTRVDNHILAFLISALKLSYHCVYNCEQTILIIIPREDIWPSHTQTIIEVSLAAFLLKTCPSSNIFWFNVHCISGFTDLEVRDHKSSCFPQLFISH